MYSVITAFSLSYVEKFDQDEAFHMAISITQRQFLYEKIPKPIMILKILNDMNPFMAHIFVK